ncbi:glycoside hydrolase family 27 protein [Pseudoflavonifractor phocaeensis]|uniref:glycoside hydrolase family 27 protein n=1 Tax=Pseudoflavonifractor phocaeensis TaxID=1870988 RepID=UPI00210F0DCA|nr:glycoside hydrolase family 27 protein [Pseudoflavonifractor phocaeensis]MCQ4865154.1 glycoside hydrolase family 27 protein [Pseudoflavonifractor phocaeensis]
MLIDRPPMGWNSWNTFTNKINDQTIRETADAMVEQGLAEAGYNYLVIDDSWSERERDQDGNLVVCRAKFPHGMKSLADYVHSKGLKFGMYSCAGVRTCMDYPGSFGHEFQDARYFADIGVDFLKYDYCYKPSQADGPMLYNRMSIALKSTGRDILLSACSWGRDNTPQWVRSTGAGMFRSTSDITDTYTSIRDIAFSQLDNLPYSAPGCFNDLDMLVVGLNGNGSIGFGQGCTEVEYRQHFAFWCMLSAPLMLGLDVRNITKEARDLLVNSELLEIDQDPEARPPYMHRLQFNRDGFGDENVRIMFKHLSGGDYAVGIFNFGDEDTGANVRFYDIGIDPMCGYGFELTDVFTGENVGTYHEIYTMKIAAHDCRVYRAKLVQCGHGGL